MPLPLASVSLKCAVSTGRSSKNLTREEAFKQIKQEKN